MAETVDQMSPKASPGAMKKKGVRRVNNFPMFIVIGALTVFVAIIVIVAAKRSSQQNSSPAEQSQGTRNRDTSGMAAEIVAGRDSMYIEPLKLEAPKPPEVAAMPIAKLDNPDVPPVPPRIAIAEEQVALDSNAQRIQAIKIQQFEDAVKAKTNIALQLDKLGRSKEGNSALSSLAAIRSQIEGGAGGGDIDPTTAYQASLQQAQALIAGSLGAAGGAGGGGGSSPQPSSTPGRNDISQFAGSGQADRWALNNAIDAPRTAFEIRTGGVVPGVMISGVNSDLPGQIMGQVSQDVYDTATGKYLLIPQGTRLIGAYTSDLVYGQSAVMIAWQRMIFPDGKALDIGAMPGGDGAGYTGFRDQVNNHYVRIFSSAFLMSAVTAGITYSQNRNQNNNSNSQQTAGSTLSEALGQQLGQVTSQMIAKNLNIAPTLEIRPGYRFNIIVVKDMTFTKPYKSFDY